jgi:hypothetical protein
MEDPEPSRSLNRTFPTLEALSISSPDDEILTLPDNFEAPHLRCLDLENIHISEVSKLLTSATANLVSLHLEEIHPSCYTPPECLVELISGFPQLEILSISFIPSLPFPDIERGIPYTQATHGVLPKLWSLTFTGDSAYLDRMLDLVSAPLLQCFHVRYFLEPTLAVQSLSKFLNTIQNLNIRAVALSFSENLTITYYPRKPSDSPSCLMFCIYDNYSNPFNDEVATAMQICTAVSPAARIVEDLALEFHRPHVPDDFFVRRELWHAFLCLFGAIRTLRADVALTPELSHILNPDIGTPAEELLPLLSELVVVSRIDPVRNPFVPLIQSRTLAGHHINLRVIKQHPSPRPPSIRWTYSAFGCGIW